MIKIRASFSSPQIVVKSSSCPCPRYSLKIARGSSWCKNENGVCSNLHDYDEKKHHVFCKKKNVVAETKERKWFEKLPEPAKTPSFNWSAFFTFLAPSVISKILKHSDTPGVEIVPETRALIIRFLKSKNKVFHYNHLLRFFELGDRNYIWIKADGSVEMYCSATKITIINKNVSNLINDLRRYYRTLVFSLK